MRELARPPRNVLLLRRLCSALVFRISLLRMITGVSAKGSAILVVLLFFSIRRSPPFSFEGLGDTSCIRERERPRSSSLLT